MMTEAPSGRHREIAAFAFQFFWNHMWQDGKPWKEIAGWEREAWCRVVQFCEWKLNQ